MEAQINTESTGGFTLNFVQGFCLNFPTDRLKVFLSEIIQSAET